ncbi:MAG: MFS transporter, partial [Clostridia bacterium]|nr:MFS transporter [Clostridia bacterium]
LVSVALWSVLSFFARALDGIIDIPLAHFTDNLKTRWGKRRISILIGFVPMMLAYGLFLIPITPGPSVANTIWFAVLLCIFYSGYTLTMLGYYATFSEICENEQSVVLLSNVKSICDVAYFSLGFALLPAFVAMGMNIRTVAMIFMPLAFTMFIPLFMIKEPPTNVEIPDSIKKPKLNLLQSFTTAAANKQFVYWMCVCSMMNLGMQLFLNGINEFFSTTGINMTFVMASAFAPVPFTMTAYNKITKKYGLGVGFRFVLLVFALGMSLMFFCRNIPTQYLLWFAIMCGVIVSFAIGAFFSVTYVVPSHIAALEKQRTGKEAASMYFAVQGLFQGVTTALASQVILVYLKDSNNIQYMTILVAVCCAIAAAMTFGFHKDVSTIGKE